MRFCFGDIVVVEKDLIGVVVRTWEDSTCDVFVRHCNAILSYDEDQVERYMVRHRQLNEEELMYQKNALSRE